MPERTKTLQPYWLDYEVYFRITSADKYRNWLHRYVVIPPFTNNSDINNGRPDLTRPNYNEASTIDELNTDDTE